MRLLLCIAVAIWAYAAMPAGPSVSAEDCGCGSNGAHSCFHHRCYRRCAPCRNCEGGYNKSAPANNGWKDAPAPVVMQSMPYFAMPMVFAQMPVMPVAAASKAAPEPFDKAAPSCQGSSARLDGLDRDVRDLHGKVEALLESVRQQNEALRQMRNMMSKPNVLEPTP